MALGPATAMEMAPIAELSESDMDEKEDAVEYKPLKINNRP